MLLWYVWFHALFLVCSVSSHTPGPMSLYLLIYTDCRSGEEHGWVSWVWFFLLPVTRPLMNGTGHSWFPTSMIHMTVRTVWRKEVIAVTCGPCSDPVPQSSVTVFTPQCLCQELYSGCWWTHSGVCGRRVQVKEHVVEPSGPSSSMSWTDACDNAQKPERERETLSSN